MQGTVKYRLWGIFVFVFLFSLLMPNEKGHAYDVNRCLSLNGTNYLEAQRPLIPVTESFTVEAWVYSDPANRGRFAHFISQGNRPWPFYLGVTPNGNLRAGDAWSDTGIPLPESEWVHVAFSYDSVGKGSVFINGELKGTKSDFKLSDGPTNTRLGVQYAAPLYEYFVGCIDDVRIFRGTRSEDLIKTSMNLSTEQFYTSSASLRSLVTYSFDLAANHEASSRVSAQIKDVGKGLGGDSTDDLLAPSQTVRLAPRNDYVSNDRVNNCLSPSSTPSSLIGAPSIPMIVRIVNRSNTDLTVDFDLSKVSDGACVGADLYIQGSPNPISSTVGIRQVREPLRDRLSIDMTPVKCYFHKSDQYNHPLVLRSWYTLNGRTTKYSSEMEVPACSKLPNNNPSDPSRLLKGNETISLTSSNVNTARFLKQANVKGQALGLFSGTTNPTSTSWKVLEDWGCHVQVMDSTVEAFENGVWQKVAGLQGFEKSPNCPTTHPYQPFAVISLKDGQLFRWRISSGWISYSPVRAFFANEQSSGVAGKDASNPIQGLPTAKATKDETSSTIKISRPKPNTPSFSAVNFSGNKFNIVVNLGSSTSTRPDKVYLVAPKLGFTASNPLAGSIGGNTARWSIEFDKLLAGMMIPLEIVGEKDGEKSDALTGSYQVPELSVAATKAPSAPTNIKQRVVGSSIVVTSEAKLTKGALVTEAFLFSKTLGISKSQALAGDVVGNKVVFEIPLKASMAGKKYAITIYYSNSKGESEPANATITAPALPKVPKINDAIPTPVDSTTVLCLRASQTRAFSGSKCPPGWNEKK